MFLMIFNAFQMCLHAWHPECKILIVNVGWHPKFSILNTRNIFENPQLDAFQNAGVSTINPTFHRKCSMDEFEFISKYLSLHF